MKNTDISLDFMTTKSRYLPNKKEVPSKPRKRKPVNPPTLATEDKYKMYEASVQNPSEQVKVFPKMYSDIFSSSCRVIREDFCGTFFISTEWVKSHPDNRAIALDINQEPLDFGLKHHFKKLSKAEQNRIKVKNQNVLTAKSPKVDMVTACNFSFFTFKERELLKQYCQAAHQSLKAKGLMVLEIIGGPGFMDVPYREQRTESFRDASNREKKFTYIWQHRLFDPIEQHGLYTISFKMPNGTLHKDAFVYDWRVWTIPEVADILREAGFNDVVIYADAEDKKGNPTGEYRQTSKLTDDHTWICYLVAIKK